MTAPGPAALGRGVVVGADQAAPPAWADARRLRLDGPAALGELRAAYAGRTPLVIECVLDPATFRAPPSWRGDVWSLDPGFCFADEELQFLLWANTYDARAGEPVWWWGRKALRAGATPLPDGVEGDVAVGGVPVWVDGGPRQVLPGLAVVHRESVEQGRVRVAPPWRPPSAELAPDQLAAVGHDRGAARIIAPAGSGKTRVLTERVRHLLADRAYEPDAVLAVAYNKRAQQELEVRCAGLPVRCRTLNSLGLWVCSEALGRSPAVLSESQVRDEVRRHAPRLQKRVNTDPLAPYLEALSTVRLGLVDPEVVEARRDDVPGLGPVFAGLRERFRREGSVDFDEQIYAAVEALLADGALRTRLQQRCRHLLVDEFQDLTPAHVLLVRLLAGPQADVFGVGDDDQVIYGHAGADPRFLIDFADFFPGAGAHALEVNYRCPPEVVTAAATLLSYNHRRVQKDIRAGRPAAPQGGLLLRSHPARSGAAAVVEAVAGWQATGAAPADIAVLARVRAALLAPVVALRAAGVPVDAAVGPELLERTGVRAALAYLRLAVGPERMASADLVEVYRRPSRGLPQWFPDRLRSRTGWSLDQLDAMALKDDKVAVKVAQLSSALQSLRATAAAGADAGKLLRHVRDVTGLGTAMTMLDSSGAEGSSHIDDIDALIEVAALHPDPSGLEQFVRDHLTTAPAGPSVTASTVHRVKGLEWPYVVVAGVAEGLLPHRLADDEEEERRILHVAVTRSQHQTVVLADTSRPSPFVAELDGSAPHRAPAAVRRAPAAAAPAPASKAAGPEAVAGCLGLAVTLPGGYDGAIDRVDGDGALVRLATGATLRAAWGSLVVVAGRDRTLTHPDAAAAEAALRAWRTERARRDKVPPYIVFSDKTLQAIAAARPVDLEAMRRISGVGPAKLDSYGDDVLEVLAGIG